MKPIALAGLAALLLAGPVSAQAPQAAPRRPFADDVPACAGSVPMPSPPAGYVVPGAAPPAPPAPQPARPPMPPATAPSPIRPGAMPKHNCFMEVARRGQIDLLFEGDSITDFFLRGDRGQAVWLNHYGALPAANFGISGDTTQDVLGRIAAGELDGFQAKVIVLMLGTNNLNRNTNSDIVAGDAAILAEFRKHQPQAKVLLLGIFPRGAPNTPTRESLKEINEGLAKLADNRNVFYLDIGPSFTNPDGSLINGLFVDGLHPTAYGYEVWARAIDPTMKTLLAGGTP